MEDNSFSSFQEKKRRNWSVEGSVEAGVRSHSLRVRNMFLAETGGLELLNSTVAHCFSNFSIQKITRSVF